MKDVVRRVLVPALVVLSTVIQAQIPSGNRGTGPGSGATVSGVVVDAETGKSIPNATVSLWHAADSSLAEGVITEENGRFSLGGLRQGNYYLRVSYVGFTSQTVNDLSVDGQRNVDLGPVRLSTAVREVDEVEITAERSFIEVGIDRNVYNVRNQIVSMGGNGLDVLRNVPSVEVDIDGAISLRGNQNVAIHINGRPTPMSADALNGFLQGLAAETIERVEVIPNPSARYEPDGMAGILNIVLRQNERTNLSGNVSLNGDTRENFGGAASVNVQKGKFGVYAGYGLRLGKRSMDAWRFQEYRTTQPLMVVDENSFDRNRMSGHNLTANLDYRFTPKTSLTLASIVSVRGGEENGRSILDQSDVGTSAFDRTELITSGDDTDLGMDYRLSLQHIIVPRENELTIEARIRSDHETENGLQSRHLIEGSADGLRSLEGQQDQRMGEATLNGAFQVDYMRSFGEGFRFETGYKGDREQIDSDLDEQNWNIETGMWDPALAFVNSFDYRQTIHAGYGIVGARSGQWGLQLGLRAETAVRTFELSQTDEAFDKRYTSLFPSAFLTFEPAQGTSFRLSYSKRINRPRAHGWFNMLNPITDDQNPLFRRAGNPYLDPEYIHSFEATFNKIAGTATLTVTPYFRRTTDVIRGLERLDENGITWFTFDNFNTSDSWGAEAVASLQLGRWLNGFVDFNGYRIVTDGSNVETGLQSDAFGFSTRANASIALPRGLDLQLTWFYRSPIDIESGHVAAQNAADVAIRQKLMGERASLSLRVSDVFGTRGWQMWRDNPQFRMESERNFDSQRIGLSFTYNFGAIQRQQRRNRGNDDEGPGGPGNTMPDVPMQ